MSSQVFTKEETEFVIQAVKGQLEASKLNLAKKVEEFEQLHKRMEVEILNLRGEIQSKEATLKKMEKAINKGGTSTIGQTQTLPETIEEIKKSRPPEPLKPIPLDTFVDITYKAKTGIMRTKRVPNSLLEYIKKNYMDNVWRNQKDLIHDLKRQFPKYTEGTLSVYLCLIVEYFNMKKLAEKDKTKFKLFKLKTGSMEEIQQALKTEYHIDRELKK